MHRSFGMNRTLSPFVAVAMFAMGQQMAAFGEDGLQLRVPQSFSSASSAAQLDEHGTPAACAVQAYDEVEVIRERYPDGKIKIERQVTLDADGNYVNHGPWKLYSPSEIIIAEGQYDMGKRVGNWTRWLGKNDSKVFAQQPFKSFKPPFASQATFTDGVMDGEWLVVDADNNKMLQISLTVGQTQRPDDHLPAERQDLPPGQLRSRRAGRRRARSRQQDGRAETRCHVRRRPPHHHQDRPLQTHAIAIAKAKS